MAGQARSGFAMDIVGQSSNSKAISRPNSDHHHHHTHTNRHNAFREDDEDDGEEEDHLQRLHGSGSSTRHHHSRNNGNGGRSSRDELLTGYSRSNGAEKVRKSPPRQGPKIIAKQADLDWMEERKRRLGLEKYREQLGSLTSMRTAGSSTQPANDQVREAISERIGDEKQLSGLQIRKKVESSREDEEMEEIGQLQERAKESRNGMEGDRTPPLSQAGESPPHQGQSREDEAARQALLSGQGLGASFRIEEERVIALSEEEALKRTLTQDPEPPSMSDYAKMPVEEFGAALLRGMGWKEGTGAGKNKQGPTSAPEVKKRAALLGLGAKERKLDNDSQGMEAQKQEISGLRGQREDIYPVTRIEREKRESDSQSRQIEDGRRRERSQSPSRKRRDRDDAYNRQDDRRYHERSDRDIHLDDSERERERRKQRERERDGSYHSSTRSDRR